MAAEFLRTLELYAIPQDRDGDELIWKENVRILNAFIEIITVIARLRVVLIRSIMDRAHIRYQQNGMTGSRWQRILTME